MTHSRSSSLLHPVRPRARASATVLAATGGLVLALPFVAASATAAPATAGPSTAVSLANPAHHRAGAAPAVPAVVVPRAVPAAPAATPVHTFHPVASAPDAPQDSAYLGSGTCHSTNADGGCTLRAAVMEANRDGVYTAIALTSGTYQLTIPPGGTTDASTGNLDITDPQTVAFTGAGSTQTFVDASGMPDRIFRLEDHGVATMTGFSLENGDASLTSGNTDPGNGGAIDVSSAAASLVLQSVRIMNSTAEHFGGGVYANGTVWATSSQFSGNNAQVGGGFYSFGSAQLVGDTVSGNTVSYSGGGMYLTGGGVSVQGGTVSGNHVIFDGSRGAGGGIYVTEGTTIVGTTISNNTVAPSSTATSGNAQGGGLYVEYGLNQADHLTIKGNTVSGFDDSTSCCDGDGGGGIYDKVGFTLTNSTLTGNKALTGLGGALLNTGNVEQLTHVTIAGNSAAQDGGGIYAWDITAISQSTISGNTAGRYGGGFFGDDGQQIDQSLFTGNKALQGGAIWNEWKVLLTNDTLTGNQATGTGNAGGAIYNAHNNNNGTVQLTNVTVSSNRSDDGGGIAQFGDGLSVHNTIIAGNHANSGSTDTNCDISSTGASPLTSQGYNLDSGHTCGLNGPGDKSNTNPRLGALANNGGPTRTQALLSGSPAINTGHSPAPSVDQRGVKRDSRPDRGAFEKK